MKIISEGVNEPVDDFKNRDPDRVYVKVPIKNEVPVFQPTLDEYLRNGWKLETDDPKIVKARNTAIVSIEREKYIRSKEYYRMQGHERVFSEQFLRTKSPYIKSGLKVDVTQGDSVSIDTSRLEPTYETLPPTPDFSKEKPGVEG